MKIRKSKGKYYVSVRISKTDRDFLYGFNKYQSPGIVRMADQSFSNMIYWAVVEEWIKDTVMPLQFEKKKLTAKQGKSIFADIHKSFEVYTNTLVKYHDKLGGMLYGDEKKKRRKKN